MISKIVLTEELLVAYLGMPQQRCGDELVWQCPICAQAGCDTSKDNFKYNTRKNVCNCFASNEHSRMILSDIFKNEWKNERTSLNTSIQNVDGQEYEIIENELLKSFLEEHNGHFNYVNHCLDILEHDKTGLCKDALSLRGLTVETALDVGLGYDDYNNRWVIPTVAYSTLTNCDDYKVIGYEYRPIDFDKSRLGREKGGKTGLAMISPFTDKVEYLLIVEGYFDGYAWFQHLTEQGIIDKYHIVTCSNGVNSLFKQVSEIDFSKYKKVYLNIDNDEPGRKAANDILEKYPFMIDITFQCGCKDFNEHYIKCIKKLNNNT